MAVTTLNGETLVHTASVGRTILNTYSTDDRIKILPFESGSCSLGANSFNKVYYNKADTYFQTVQSDSFDIDECLTNPPYNPGVISATNGTNAYNYPDTDYFFNNLKLFSIFAYDTADYSGLGTSRNSLTEGVKNYFLYDMIQTSTSNFLTEYNTHYNLNLNIYNAYIYNHTTSSTVDSNDCSFTIDNPLSTTDISNGSKLLLTKLTASSSESAFINLTPVTYVTGTYDSTSDKYTFELSDVYNNRKYYHLTTNLIYSCAYDTSEYLTVKTTYDIE